MASPAGVVPRQRLAQDLASSRQISTGLLERRVRPLSTFCIPHTFSVNRLKGGMNSMAEFNISFHEDMKSQAAQELAREQRDKDDDVLGF